MDAKNMITLESKTLDGERVIARIMTNPAQLVNLLLGGMEFMHGGGLPDAMKKPADKVGWNQSEILCFPVFGEPADGKIIVRDKNAQTTQTYPMMKHGLLRDMPTTLLSHSQNAATFTQEYAAGNKVFSGKNPSVYSTFPHSFRVVRTYLLNRNCLEESCVIINTTKEPMPSKLNDDLLRYMFAFHPAFRRQNPEYPTFDEELTFYTPNNNIIKKVSLEDIATYCDKKIPGHGAFFIEGASKVRYQNNNRTIVMTHNVKNVAVWSPKRAGQIAIEPTTRFLNHSQKEYRPFIDDDVGLTLIAGRSVTYKMNIHISRT